MAVEYQDYYQTLGVDRGASQDEIQKAYKRLARKHHPDLNPDDASSEDRFKLVGEAYEVLRDPEKRARYDQLGANWKAGQRFEPPPEWGGFRVNVGNGQGFSGGPGGLGGMSDFFRTIFGGDLGGGFGGGGFEQAFQQSGRGRGFSAGRGASEDVTADLYVSLDEVVDGAVKEFTLNIQDEEQRLKVRIPKGVTEGKTIRLSGRGQRGGDLLLRLRIAAHPQFEVDDYDLSTNVKVTPWEAALGASVEVPTLNGTVRLKIPAGVQGGQKMRLARKGLPRAKGAAGDLFATITIVVPTKLSDEERALFEQLAAVSSFAPRA